MNRYIYLHCNIINVVIFIILIPYIWLSINHDWLIQLVKLLKEHFQIALGALLYISWLNLNISGSFVVKMILVLKWFSQITQALLLCSFGDRWVHIPWFGQWSDKVNPWLRLQERVFDLSCCFFSFAVVVGHVPDNACSISICLRVRTRQTRASSPSIMDIKDAFYCNIS